jgi:hypothetical protein
VGDVQITQVLKIFMFLDQVMMTNILLAAFKVRQGRKVM